MTSRRPIETLDDICESLSDPGTLAVPAFDPETKPAPTIEPIEIRQPSKASSLLAWVFVTTAVLLLFYFITR